MIDLLVLGSAADHCQSAKAYMTMRIYCLEDREKEKSKMNEKKGSVGEKVRAVMWTR